jgi:hypothetical protein
VQLCNISTPLGIAESRRFEAHDVLCLEDHGRALEDAIAISGRWTKYSIAVVNTIPASTALSAGLPAESLGGQ